MRAACWTCRSRTIQCDRTSTPCAKCVKAGLECFQERPLRWVKGIAIRGKMRGRVLGMDPKASGEKTSEQRKRKKTSHSRAESLATNITPPISLQDPFIHDLDWSSRFYLDYYNIHIAKLYILYDSESNPFRSLLAHAMDDSTLRKCIIAVAARHFANTGRSFDQPDDALSVSPRFVNANLDALHFKSQAIKALSFSLSHSEPLQKDSIMASILLLIFLDLLESGIEGWKYHLNGAERLVNLSHSLLEPSVGANSNSGSGETVEVTRRFITRQFSLISTIGSALSGSRSSPELCIDFDSGQQQESIIRSFLGCPSFLLGAIRHFSDQRHVIQSLNMHDDASVHEHVRDTLAMLQLTAKFDCMKWASDSVQSKVSSSVEIQTLSLLAQAYRTAVMLYGNQVLSACKTSAAPTESDNKGLVLQLLDVIDSLKCDAALFKCLLWPTFIAGLECQTPSEQERVVCSLRILWDLTCCLNVINASKVLHEYWKRKHFDGDMASDASEFHVLEQGWLLI
ncbi:fungal-specific transcription factor domain-containing protein [Aspergillus floccosus]